MNGIRDWDVIDDAMDSDHRLIKYQVSCGSMMAHAQVDRRRHNVKKANWDEFRRVLSQEVMRRSYRLDGGVEEMSKALVTYVRSQCRIRCQNHEDKLSQNHRGGITAWTKQRGRSRCSEEQETGELRTEKSIEE